MIPNRRGLWARTDTTPFGYGRPYSRAQITHILRETWFTPNGWGEALYVPPVARGWFLRTAIAWERTGSTISAPFAGVHIVEATKQVYRAIPARREKRQLVPGLEPVLAPSPGGAARNLCTKPTIELGSAGDGGALNSFATVRLFARGLRPGAVSLVRLLTALSVLIGTAAAPAAMRGKRSPW